MTPTERAIHANHPSAQSLKNKVSAPTSAEVVVQEPSVTEPSSPSVTLGELSDTADAIGDAVARLRLLKGGRK